MSQPRPPANKPGRYQRTTGGLVGSMIVLVVAVVVLWQALGAFRDEPDTLPGSTVSPTQYEADVAALADAGFAFTFPQTVPQGWRLNAEPIVDRDEGLFRVTFLTTSGGSAAVYSGREDLDDVLELLVDEDTSDEGTTALSDVDGTTSSWTVHTDDGGDTAYGLADEESTVLVYGSADPAELEALVSLLQTSP